jgi:hypothetical protein
MKAHFLEQNDYSAAYGARRGEKFFALTANAVLFIS